MRTWKNTTGSDRTQKTIWRMRIARCIPKTTNTHSECVIIIAFQLQQWLHKRTSLLRYTYIGFHANFCHTWMHHSQSGNDGLDLDAREMLCCRNALKNYCPPYNYCFRITVPKHPFSVF